MNFDYRETQVSLTYQMVGVAGWMLKGRATEAEPDSPGNEAFFAQRAEMDNTGWALVSLEALPGTIKQSTDVNLTRYQTSNYNLSWKRAKSALLR